MGLKNPGGGTVSAAVTSLAANSVTAAAVADGMIDAATFAAGAIDAAAIAASAIGTSEFAAAVDARIVDAVFEEVLDTDHDTATTFGVTVWRPLIKDITFTGVAGAGEIGTVVVATNSGDVELRAYYEKCTTDLVGAATLVTTAGSAPTILMVETANATTIDAGKWNLGAGTWVAGAGWNGVNSVPGPLTISSSIVMTVGAANITGGVIRVYIEWRPKSAGATLT